MKRFFEAASIQRWNDHISPVLLTELDKQAHKMVIAYVIAKFEEERREVDWIRLIEGGMFEFLHRVVLTDIKPPVFHRMMREKRAKLNEYVLGELEDEIRGLDEGFQQNFRKYIADSEYSAFEKSIL
ncbi:MAG: HAD family hydrolase, partial [Euryarchaeota archaeon]|nr:HAD family hydrolase [Euryarchaeota archaeon]